MKKILLLLIAGMVLVLPKLGLAQTSTSGWEGHIFAGYAASNGNTKNSTGSIEAAAINKMENGELDLAANIMSTTQGGHMNGQKWDALAKYLLNFGHENRYYNFYQVFVDHDWAANINYRITPSTGLGYHILVSDPWQWDVDAGIGYRITQYNNPSSSTNLATVLAHTFISRRVFEKSLISEDLTVYPGLKSHSPILTKSVTAFICPLMANLDLELKFIFQNNSAPAAGSKKSDEEFIAGLRYKF